VICKVKQAVRRQDPPDDSPPTPLPWPIYQPMRWRSPASGPPIRARWSRRTRSPNVAPGRTMVS